MCNISLYWKNCRTRQHIVDVSGLVCGWCSDYSFKLIQHCSETFTTRKEQREHTTKYGIEGKRNYSTLIMTFGTSFQLSWATFHCTGKTVLMFLDDSVFDVQIAAFNWSNIAQKVLEQEKNSEDTQSVELQGKETTLHWSWQLRRSLSVLEKLWVKLNWATNCWCVWITLCLMLFGLQISIDLTIAQKPLEQKKE